MSNNRESQLENLDTGFDFREFIKHEKIENEKIIPITLKKEKSIFDKIVRKRFDSLDYTAREIEQKNIEKDYLFFNPENFITKKKINRETHHNSRRRKSSVIDYHEKKIIKLRVI